MTFSNNTAKIIATALVALTFSACTERDNSQIKNADNATFYVDTVTGEFATVETNSQSLANKKVLSMAACLKDNAQTSSVNNLSFEIQAGDVHAVKRTDNKGCLYWQELVEYDPSDEVKNVNMARAIKAVESHSGLQSFTVKINPWEDKMTYSPQVPNQSVAPQSLVSYKAKDLLLASKVEYDYDFAVQLSNRSAMGGSNIRRQSEITELRLDYRKIDYSKFEIDSNLNLTVPYNYVTNLSISLLRQSLSELSPIKIKSGRFQFHLIFLSEKANLKNPKPTDVLSAAQFSGKPYGDAGIIQESIALKFKNVAALASRMNVLLTVTSLDQPQLFEDQTFEGVVDRITANEDLAVSLIPNESNARMLYQAYTSLPVAASAEKTIANKLNESGFFFALRDKVSFTKEGYSNIQVDLNSVLQKVATEKVLSPNDKSALCSAFFMGQYKAETMKTLYNRCLFTPERFLEAKTADFVVSLNSPNVSVSIGRPETLEVTASIGLSEDSSKERGDNLNAKGEAAGSLEIATPPDLPSLPFLPKVKGQASAKLSMGADIYYIASYKRNQTDSKLVSISSTEKLTSEPMFIGMDVNIRRCLLISAKTGSELEKFVRINQMKSGRYLCDTRVEKAQKTEVYYFLNHVRGLETSSVNDKNSSEANPLRLFVRGSNMHGYLKSILANDKFKFRVLLGKMTAQKVLDDPSNLMTEEMPAMLSSGQKDAFAK